MEMIIVVGEVNRDVTTVEKNGKSYAKLSVKTERQFGDRTFKKFYSVTCNPDLTSGINKGDTVAVQGDPGSYGITKDDGTVSHGITIFAFKVEKVSSGSSSGYNDAPSYDAGDLPF